MITQPIYKPNGKAYEYAKYALNIYTGCPHGCTYCYVPAVLHKTREDFHSHVEQRKDILESVSRQLERENIHGETIHLCFTCDPYPAGKDTTITREIVKAIKESGNHVQILTKNPTDRDFDLLDKDDWFGVTFSCYKDKDVIAEPNAMPPLLRLGYLKGARLHRIKTWISAEPVIDPYSIFALIDNFPFIYFDKISIGKMNYQKSNIDWKWFANSCKSLCDEDRNGINYVLKDDLKKLLEDQS